MRPTLFTRQIIFVVESYLRHIYSPCLDMISDAIVWGIVIKARVTDIIFLCYYFMTYVLCAKLLALKHWQIMPLVYNH